MVDTTARRHLDVKLNIPLVATVKWSLAGVPKGQEETLRAALEGYYVNG